MRLGRRPPQALPVDPVSPAQFDLPALAARLAHEGGLLSVRHRRELTGAAVRTPPGWRESRPDIKTRNIFRHAHSLAEHWITGQGRTSPLLRGDRCGMVSGPQAVRYRGSGCTPRRPSRWATGSKRQHTCWPPATATPALAFPHGAAPEIIDHGRTGYLCRGEDEMTATVARLHQISRRHCRAAAEQRFSLARMAADYDRLYRASSNVPDGPRPSEPQRAHRASAEEHGRGPAVTALRGKPGQSRRAGRSSLPRSAPAADRSASSGTGRHGPLPWGQPAGPDDLHREPGGQRRWHARVGRDNDRVERGELPALPRSGHRPGPRRCRRRARPGCGAPARPGAGADRAGGPGRPGRGLPACCPRRGPRHGGTARPATRPSRCAR